MSRRTILRFARPTTLQAVLDGIAARTNTKQGPDLPQVTTLKPLVAEETDLPVFVDAPPDGKVGFIYCAGHCPHVPPGEPPVIVCFRPLPGFGCEEEGVFSGAIVVSVWQHPEYPMSPKEVEWSIAQDCGCEDHEWSELSLCWQKLNAIVHDDLQDLAAAYEANGDTDQSELAPDANGKQDSLPPVDGHGTDQSQQRAVKKPKRNRTTDPSHRGTRPPRKAPSRYLMVNMWVMDDLYDFEHLFDGYCHVYEDTEGHLPSNPRASFLEAAYSCVERILRMRGRGDKRPTYAVPTRVLPT